MLQIDKSIYTVSIIDILTTIKLVKYDATEYQITTTEGKSKCSCDDWTFSRRTSASPCKHLYSLRKIGLMMSSKKAGQG